MAEKEGILDIFSWMGTQIKSLFVKAEPAVVAVVRRFFSEFEGIAIEAVAAEAPKVLDGSDKFSNAVANVQAQVISQGWSVSSTLLRTLVQDAYTAWKLNQKSVAGEVLVKAPV